MIPDHEVRHEDGSRTVYRNGFALYYPPPLSADERRRLFDPVENIKAALAYMRDRYGSNPRA